MKRMFLLFNGRFPSEKAASLFAGKSAEVFAGQNLEVRLLVPRRRGVDSRAAFDYYDLKKNFEIVQLPTVDFFVWPIPDRLAFYLNFLVFSLVCYVYLRRQGLGKSDLVYSNESLPLYFASFLTDSVFYEMHDFPESKLGLFAIMVKRFKWILIHNRWKMEKFQKIFSKCPAKLIYEPNAVDLKDFDIPISKIEAREKLGLPTEKKIIVYTGHLFGWKGAHVLAEAAAELSDDFRVFFVGGTDVDVLKFREKYGDLASIMIVGFKPHKEIPLWQKAADILVLPNTAKEAISAYYTSPMKLFEYMASRRPIVASDIPSIREIVGDDCALLVKADEPGALAQALERLSGDTALAESLIEKAFEKVSRWTWEQRARDIINFTEQNV